MRSAILLAALGACAARPAAPPERPRAEPAAAALTDPIPPAPPALEAPWPRPATAAGWPAADGLAPWGTLGTRKSYCDTQAFNDVVIVCDDTGIRSSRLAHPASSVHVVSRLNNVLPRVRAGLLLGKLAEHLVALDPRTLATRWQTVIETPEDAAHWDGTQLRAVLDHGTHLAVMLWTQWSDVGEIVGLDAVTGRILWRAPTSTHGAPGLLAVAGSRLVRWEPEALIAVDLSSGQRAWSVDLPREEEAFVTADEGHVAAETPRGHDAELTIVDAGEGRVVRRERLTDITYHAMALDRGQLFRARQPHDGSIVYEAVAVDTGRVLWTTPPTEGWMASRKLFFLDADVAFADNGDGDLRAFDRRTGAQRWSWGFDSLALTLAIVRPAPGAPGLLVAESEVFERRPGVTPTFEIAVSGHIRDSGKPVAGAVIEAAGRHTVTDAAGAYRLTVKGRGKIRIQARSARGLASEHVDAEGNHHQTVSFDVTPRTSRDVD